LDHALERTRAVGRVLAKVPDQCLGRFGQLDLDVPLAHPLDQPPHLQLDDLRDLLAGQRTELDDVVKAVDELGLELRLDPRPGCSRS
jgi:hypothetical protein